MTGLFNGDEPPLSSWYWDIRMLHLLASHFYFLFWIPLRLWKQLGKEISEGQEMGSTGEARGLVTENFPLIGDGHFAQWTGSSWVTVFEIYARGAAPGIDQRVNAFLFLPGLRIIDGWSWCTWEKTWRWATSSKKCRIFFCGTGSWLLPWLSLKSSFQSDTLELGGKDWEFAMCSIFASTNMMTISKASSDDTRFVYCSGSQKVSLGSMTNQGNQDHPGPKPALLGLFSFWCGQWSYLQIHRQFRLIELCLVNFWM